METGRRMRVAIIGGGLAGAAVANALMELPHVSIDVFEAVPTFSERGAAVGLSVNAQCALDRLSASSGKQTLVDAGGVAVNSIRTVVGSGPKAGTLVIDMVRKVPTIVVHRAALLKQLLAPIPPDLLHAGKRLRDMVTGPDGIQLTFEDDTSDVFDLVVGADGIFGLVRGFVLQGDADKHAASPAGFWDSRNLVSLERAKEALGDEYFEVPRQYGWCGDGAFVMHDVSDDGGTVHCVISCIEPDSSRRDRAVPLDRDFLERSLANWLDGPIGKGIIDLLLEQHNPQGYSQWEHKSTPTYTNGHLCIVGDAAHATTPWQGAGAGLALEDAVVLGAVLRNCASPDHLASAMRAFDAVRRPRCQRVIDSSRRTGHIVCGQIEGGHSDPDKTAQLLAHRWDFIHDFDLDKHVEDALCRMRDE